MSYVDFITWLKETWPHPPDSVLANLRHTLDTYDNDLLGFHSRPKDEEFALTATLGVYTDEAGNRVKTGLTWGDLRAIRKYLERMWEIDGERPMDPLLNIPLHNFGPGKRPTIR